MILKDIIGSLLVITSIFDAIKYYWSAEKIKSVGTAKGHSRKFLNAAIINDIVKFMYGFVIIDIFIIASSILALLTMGYNFFIVYKYYPYRYRGLMGFKKPSILYYILNSFLPNKIRRRL